MSDSVDPSVNKLQSIITRQKEITSELENEALKLSKSDFVVENEKIKKELQDLCVLFEKEQNENKKNIEENKNLRNALYEHIYNEKIAILNAVNNKTNAYFKDTVEREKNRLIEFEKSSKEKIFNIYKILKDYRLDAEDEIYEKLSEVKDLLDKKVTQAITEYEKHSGAYGENKDREFNKLHSEKVTEEEIRSAAKKNNIESLIGLNIINKIGILFLIIGIIAASQYTYFKLPDILKGILIFVGGAVLLVVGEILNRKKPNIFSLGISSAGVAVLYSALGLSYFGLKILDMYPAIILCILITLVSFVLSQRYNSQSIATFALIGGYLPILSIEGNKTLIYSAMAYFVVLNVFALVISVNKKWVVSQFVGFALNVSATIYIAGLIFSSRKYNLPFNKSDLILLAYIAFTFVIYTLIPVLSTYFRKLKFKTSDIVLLGLNTLISSLIMYNAFYQLKLNDFTGLLAICFAVIYLLLGRFIETKLTEEKNAKALFYLTGFSFVVLIVPFQFGKMWLSQGWLVEGVALATYGILKEEKNFKRGGFIIFGLCAAAFVIFDLVLDISYKIFMYKYMAITLGSLIILASLAYKKTLWSKPIKFFKYAVVVNLWLFVRHIIDDEIRDYLYENMKNSGFNVWYLTTSLKIAVTFLLAYTVLRIKVLSDWVIKVIGMGIYVIGIISILLLNAGAPYYIKYADFGYRYYNNGTVITNAGADMKLPLAIIVIGTITLIVINLLSVLAMRDLLKLLVLERKIGIEWYPLVVSAFFVLILTQNLITQYNLEFNNAVISIIYVLASFSWIVFGFVKRYAFIRRFGLGLSILAIAKLFIVDLSVISSQGLKIASYFAFGVTLIAISFVYQHFSKRLELKGDVMPDAKQETV